jgi:hypothetical protein
MKNKEMVHIVFNTLEKEIPIQWNWRPVEKEEGAGIDGNLVLMIDKHKLDFNVEIKKDLKDHQLFNLLQQKKHIDNFLLIAEKLYPKVKKELKENKVHYIEANGNAYINREGVYLHIDAHKTLQPPKGTGNRAFTKTGLKVVFHFLLTPELLNRTQREIAEVANVGLGTVPQVINGLLNTNLILKLNKKEFIINDHETLLQKWATEYAQNLKPRLFKQRFKLVNGNQNWKDIPLNRRETVWGGEPAGDIITNYLRPEQLTLYTKETTKDLMKNYKLIPDREGTIWVYDMFWKENFNAQTAPLQLVYADLMMTGDKRCRETANIILDEHIKPNL